MLREFHAYAYFCAAGYSRLAPPVDTSQATRSTIRSLPPTCAARAFSAADIRDVAAAIIHARVPVRDYRHRPFRLCREARPAIEARDGRRCAEALVVFIHGDDEDIAAMSAPRAYCRGHEVLPPAACGLSRKCHLATLVKEAIYNKVSTGLPPAPASPIILF